jgi:uncharacterized membrane protein YbhN (UPF0104 family)
MYILKKLSKYSLPIKASISAVFMYLLFSKFIQVSSFQIVRSMDFKIVFICLGLAFLSLIFKSVRWNSMIELMDGKMDFKSLVKLYTIGFYYGSISPGRAGEFVKGSRLLKGGLETKQGMVSIIYERFYDITTPLAFLSIFYLFDFLHEPAPSALLVFGCLSISIILWIFFVLLFQIFKNQIKFLRDVKDIPKEAMLRHSLVPATASVFNWLCISLSAYLLLNAFGVSIDFPRVVFAVCIALLSLLLPISINGWGVREAAFVWALSPFSEPSISIIFSITFTLIGTYSLALVGLLFELTARSS